MENRQPDSAAIPVIKYSFEDYSRDISALVEGITKPYDVVMGISRGGLPAAAHLSNILNIPLIVVEKDKAQSELLKDKRVLVVDDILDTGETLTKVCRHPYLWYSDVTIWCPFYRSESLPKVVSGQGEKPVMFISPSVEVVGNVWIEFWWEVLL